MSVRTSGGSRLREAAHPRQVAHAQRMVAVTDCRAATAADHADVITKEICARASECSGPNSDSSRPSARS
jgi:hypothetical protein